MLLINKMISKFTRSKDSMGSVDYLQDAGHGRPDRYKSITIDIEA
jgi:hypothetical protein